MNTTIQYDKAVTLAALEENQKNVREMVMESYQDMLEGKGRDYKEFFKEAEERYRSAGV